VGWRREWSIILARSSRETLRVAGRVLDAMMRNLGGGFTSFFFLGYCIKVLFLVFERSIMGNGE
jgi:hypothetical protein